MASYLPLWIVPLGPRKPSGGSWSFANGRWLRPEMPTLERVLGPLVSVQFLALVAQEIHSRVQKLLLQSCEEAVPLAESRQRPWGRGTRSERQSERGLPSAPGWSRRLRARGLLLAHSYFLDWPGET